MFMFFPFFILNSILYSFQEYIEPPGRISTFANLTLFTTSWWNRKRNMEENTAARSRSNEQVILGDARTKCAVEEDIIVIIGACDIPRNFWCYWKISKQIINTETLFFTQINWQKANIGFLKPPWFSPWLTLYFCI